MKLFIKEQDVNIEVKHEGVLEVPDGKNVDDLPFSHFEKLAKKKGLGKITKALNNLQVWNKNDDPKLSKWADNMIDKLNKKLKKDESVLREGSKGFDGPYEAAKYYFDSWYNGFITNDEITDELKRRFYSEDFIDDVFSHISDLADEQNLYDYEHDYDYFEESLLRESNIPDNYFDDEIYDDFSKQDKEIAKRMLELGWEEVGFLTTGMEFILPKTDSDENGGYETTIILPSDGKIGNIYRIDDFDEDRSTIVKNDSGTRYLHDIDDVEKFTKWFMSLPDKSIKKESRSLGGRDYDYIDPVLQEYLDFLDEAGIVVVNVNPKSKTIYVNGRDFDDAVFYMQDRDYFGKDLHSKGWIVATRA